VAGPLCPRAGNRGTAIVAVLRVDQAAHGLEAHATVSGAPGAMPTLPYSEMGMLL